MTNHSVRRRDAATSIIPWAGAAVSLGGVLTISAVTMLLPLFGWKAESPQADWAGAFAPSGLMFALALLIVSALICVVPLMVRQFPQLRSPLFYGTATQLRRFLNWFLSGLTVFALIAYAGLIGLLEPWGISITGTVFLGLGLLLVAIGIGYPPGGPDYDGPLPFTAEVTKEFARSAPLQKYGTSTLGIVLIVTGTWASSFWLFALCVISAVALWLVPWIIALVKVSQSEQENQN
ncbi:MAG: hypothetical protein L0K07_03540 [Yaniella sp.]|uniref:Hypothetical membrane protein n=1 Tax=Glutamicibacter arilaitensis (strain DSM 16368 / CIP 108037 / IAM 15318 / JCM 13566 / NCIMB 14258 / Re117) TaxID=861360 RepID=A0ABM9PTX2_GLUAR|nr:MULTISPECIES: hypothetical protein [Micrococcaceae]MDN5816132.1 hypothetical protein [Yaniella sp.]MDN5818208.1 hypothetical protein [Yaniella sp.]MDN5838096.1 hypothetical protein [Yaniella sp.]MDN5889108.1 hypothetical protein [Yaniella sp.]MDN5912244.1 hypothetical protein [Yaniella sp.]